MTKLAQAVKSMKDRIATPKHPGTPRPDFRSRNARRGAEKLKQLADVYANFRAQAIAHGLLEIQEAAATLWIPKSITLRADSVRIQGR